MLANLRQRLTYANVMSTLAVFVALGGSSYAALQIDSANIANNSVRGVDVRNRTLDERDIKRNALGGRSIRESRLGRVPRARDADRLGGMTAAELLIGCPSGTFPIADVCVETTARAAGRVRDGDRSVRFERHAGGTWKAATDARGAARARSQRVQLAAGGELTSEVYPSATRGTARCALRHRPGRQRRASPPTPAPAARRSAASPTRSTEEPIDATSKQPIAERPPACCRGPFTVAVPSFMSGLPPRSARGLVGWRGARLAKDSGGDRRRAARVLDRRLLGGDGDATGRDHRGNVGGCRRGSRASVDFEPSGETCSCPTRRRTCLTRARLGRLDEDAGPLEQEPVTDVHEQVWRPTAW